MENSNMKFFIIFYNWQIVENYIILIIYDNKSIIKTLKYSSKYIYIYIYDNGTHKMWKIIKRNAIIFKFQDNPPYITLM